MLTNGYQDARKVARLIFACKTEKAKLERGCRARQGRANAGTDMSTYLAEILTAEPADSVTPGSNHSQTAMFLHAERR